MRSILTVTSAASTSQLTTLARVKAELKITSSADDTILNAKIDEASSDIEAELNYRVAREDVSEQFWHEAQDISPEFLLLERFPVVSIDSITEDGIVLDSSLYRLDGSLGAVYRLNPSGYPWRWYFCKSVEIVYSAGYLLPGQANRNLPSGIEGAAVELLTDYWLARGRNPSVKSETIPGVIQRDYWVGSIGEEGELPPRVVMRLAPYRRPTT